MKDIQRLFFYVAAPVAIILGLIFLSGSSEGPSDSTIGTIAVLAIVVLPVIIGLLMAKNEKKKQQDDSSAN